MKRALIVGMLLCRWTAAADASPEQRAVDYLAQEVPKWSAENGCYSCHNDGDGARALYAAVQRGYRLPEAALARTTEWLARPGMWESNRGNPASSDKKLARIQFAAALTAAARASLVSDSQRTLEEAAALVQRDQETDGSWRVDMGATGGSPATYGAVLATYLSRETLKSSGARFEPAIAQADAWLRRFKPATTFDAAALLLALPERDDLVRAVMAAQAGDGGWGPSRGSPPEPFDTAVVLLALRGRPETAGAVARGRAYLLREQLETGGWPETTRPPGGQSYAQHVSTTAWATLALISTNAER